MIDVNSLTIGDEIQVMGIVGYSNTTTRMPGWINSNNLTFRIVSYDKGANLIQMKDESHDPNIVFMSSPEQITKVIAPRPKEFTLDGFGDTKFYKFEEVEKFFKTKVDEDINLSDFKNVINNRDGTQYVLELEVNSKIYEKLFEYLKVGDTLQNKITKDIGTIIQIVPITKSFDLKIIGKDEISYNQRLNTWNKIY